MLRSIKCLLAIIILSASMAACSMLTKYDPETCEEVITQINSAKQLSDISRQDWIDVYEQYMAASRELNSQLETLISTKWTAQKEADVNALLSSRLLSQWSTLDKITSSLMLPGFAPKKYFNKVQLADIEKTALKTQQNLECLKAQADK